MPLLSIETNQALDNSDTLKLLSGEVAQMLGKPESYVLLKYEHNGNMLFAGDDQPLAHLKLKSLGMPEERTPDFSRQLCRLMETHFAIPANRVYIEFSSPQRHMWGWDSTTF